MGSKRGGCDRNGRYVAHGPATVEGNQLKVTEVPARATFPLEIKVVAYQFGRGVEPLVQTAKPVERVIMVEKPEPPVGNR